MSETATAKKPAGVKLSREAMYLIIRAPVITEKATLLSEKNQYVSARRAGRDQAADQGGGGRFVRRERRRGEHDHSQGQDQAGQGPSRPPLGCEKRDRSSGERPGDRFHHQPRIRRAGNGTQTIQSGHAEPSRHGADRSLRSVEGQARQGVDRRVSTATAGATIMAASPAGFAAVATSRRIASSISGAASSTWPLSWSGWNTIRTARRFWR